MSDRREASARSPDAGNDRGAPGPGSDRKRVLLLECRLEQMQAALATAREEADHVRGKLAEVAARETEHARRFCLVHEELAEARAEIAVLHRHLERSEALRAEIAGHLFEGGVGEDTGELIRLRRKALAEDQRALISDRTVTRLRARVEELVASRETLLTRIAEWQQLIREDGPEAADLSEFLAELRREILDLERRGASSDAREAKLRERLALAGIELDEEGEQRASTRDELPAVETQSTTAEPPVAETVAEEPAPTEAGKEPAPPEPATAEAADEPVVAEPVTVEAADKPAANEPATADVTAEPVAAEPVTAAPVTGEPSEAAIAEIMLPEPEPATADPAEAATADPDEAATTDEPTAEAEPADAPDEAEPAAVEGALPESRGAPSGPPTASRTDALIAELLDAQLPELRADLLLRLGRTGDVGAADTVRPWTRSSEPSVRAAAYEALGRLLEREPEALEPHLRNGLSDTDARVRRRVVLATATARGLEPHALLDGLREDADPQVRRLVRQVLRQAPSADLSSDAVAGPSVPKRFSRV